MKIINLRFTRSIPNLGCKQTGAMSKREFSYDKVELIFDKLKIDDVIIDDW